MKLFYKVEIMRYNKTCEKINKGYQSLKAMEENMADKKNCDTRGKETRC